MPRFHFHLRAERKIHRDRDGTDLSDVAAARAYATAVAQELMIHSHPATRHWSMCVEDASGERQFDLYFAEIDSRVAALSPQVRMLMTETCQRFGALTDALCAARATLAETRVLLARARGKPYLVYARREGR